MGKRYKGFQKNSERIDGSQLTTVRQTRNSMDRSKVKVIKCEKATRHEEEISE